MEPGETVLPTVSDDVVPAWLPPINDATEAAGSTTMAGAPLSNPDPMLFTLVHGGVNDEGETSSSLPQEKKQKKPRIVENPVRRFKKNFSLKRALKEQGLMCDVCKTIPFQFYHYGAKSCNRCRAFFRRIVRRSRKGLPLPVCQTTKTHAFDTSDIPVCNISLFRGACQACRYVACINVGMRRDQVLTDEDRKKRYWKKKSSKFPDGKESKTSESGAQHQKGIDYDDLILYHPENNIKEVCLGSSIVWEFRDGDWYCQRRPGSAFFCEPQDSPPWLMNQDESMQSESVMPDYPVTSSPTYNIPTFPLGPMVQPVSQFQMMFPYHEVIASEQPEEPKSVQLDSFHQADDQILIEKPPQSSSEILPEIEDFDFEAIMDDQGTKSSTLSRDIVLGSDMNFDFDKLLDETL